MKKYSMNYEGGKCPLGYEYVSAHKQRDKWIDSYCRKLTTHRFINPDLKDQKTREKINAESLKDAENAYYSRGENHIGEVDEL